ncbi:MAG: Do family serine endopeptidase, partial [Gemmatimonadaceae bacterium]
LGVAGSGLALGVLTHDPAVAAAREAPPATATIDPLNDAFAKVAAAVKPSVVYVTAMHEARAERANQRMLDIPPEFREFFDDMIPRGNMSPSPQPMQPRQQEGSGSGFIVSADGYILTNSHVVDGASRVTVRLLDRRELDAEVVGTDPATDVAVLKIDAKGLPAVRFGDSDAARVGEWVLAVGNPLGERLTFTVTSGIISAKGRALDLPNSSARSIQDFIQTDAAINPGNSGGPLVNVRGEVIGINSAIASPTGSYAGYGFAVPSNLARRVMDQLIAHGRVERAALGISVRDAGPNDAEYVGLPSARGVLVQDFSDESSPAKRAGLLAGDVIIAVDGEEVDYVAQLQERIAFRKPGETVALEVARKGGARVTVRVPLERVPAAARSTDESEREESDAEGTKIEPMGIRVSPTNDEAVRKLELPSNARGLVVTDVNDEGPAARHLTGAGAGMGGPDVITAVEGASVRSVGDLSAAISKAGKGEVVTLRIYNTAARSWRVERVKLAG